MFHPKGVNGVSTCSVGAGVYLWEGWRKVGRPKRRPIVNIGGRTYLVRSLRRLVLAIGYRVPGSGRPRLKRSSRYIFAFFLVMVFYRFFVFVCFLFFFFPAHARTQGAGAGAEGARATSRQPVGLEKHSGGEGESDRPRRATLDMKPWKPVGLLSASLKRTKTPLEKRKGTKAVTVLQLATRTYIAIRLRWGTENDGNAPSMISLRT